MGFHKQLFKALWSDLRRGKYAAGGKVDAATHVMPTSIRVGKAGDFTLPLSSNDSLKLKTVLQPYRRSKQSVHHAWQVEASQVTSQCPAWKGLLPLAALGMNELGIDAHALGLKLVLHQMLLCEKGCQINFHRDTQREAGMFAKMILQLPTDSGHEGGKLEISHANKSVDFDFSGAQSSTGYFNTVFFCDCKHNMAEVTSGTKLCLVFNLIRSHAERVDVDAIGLTHFISALGRVQTLLKHWAADEMTKNQPVLAIPLGHEYSNAEELFLYESTKITFAGTKGHDRNVAALVLSCASFLDVHLCVLTCRDSSDESTIYELQNWTTLDDTEAKNLNYCPFQKENIVSWNHREDPFRTAEPFMKKDLVAALVVWPKHLVVEALNITEQSFVTWLGEQHKLEPDMTLSHLLRFLTVPVHDIYSDLSRVLNFCIKHSLRDATFAVMKKQVGRFSTSSHEMISAIVKYGWDDCYREVIKKTLERKKLNLFAKWPDVAKFPRHLQEKGMQRAAEKVAKKLVKRKDFAIATVSRYSQSDLLKFFLGCGSEKEILHMLSVSSSLDTSSLVQLVKAWGPEKSFPHIERFWKRSLAFARKKRYPLRRKRNWPLTPRYVWAKISHFVISLNGEEGYSDAALALGRKFANGMIRMEELYENDIEETAFSSALALLLLCPDVEKVHAALKRTNDGMARVLLQMRQATNLIGLKRDENVTQLFTDLLSQNTPQFDKTTAVFYETLFWLGDEKLVGDVVAQARRDPFSLPLDEILKKRKAMKLAERSEADRWSEVGRDGFKEVVKARLRYLLRNSSINMLKEEALEGEDDQPGEGQDPEVEEDDDDEERDFGKPAYETDYKRKYLQYGQHKHHKLEHDRALENPTAEIKRLRDLLKQ